MRIFDLLKAALSTPGGEKALAAFALRLLNGADEYRELHWGREAERGPMLATRIDVDDDSSPLVELGALHAVLYVTQKGGDPEPTGYVHQFERPTPLLCVEGLHDAEPDLVIVRSRSKFRVNSHGIIG